MPLKMNVGASRQVTDNNYGSRGASVNLEMELDTALVADSPKLQENIVCVILVKCRRVPTVPPRSSARSSLRDLNERNEAHWHVLCSKLLLVLVGRLIEG
jgi:hypothetical protein